MAAPANNPRTASCSCGRVELQAVGAPIASLVCYCDDCQEGGGSIEALQQAQRVCDDDGGTAYVVYRRDRVRCSRGDPLLKRHKIREDSATSRVVAACCNAAMFLEFDDGKHWVDVYRSRLHGDLPPLQMRVCTKFAKEKGRVATDVPCFASYPLRFVAKLIVARIAMLLRQ